MRNALLRKVDETHAREDVQAERTLHERRKAAKRRVDAEREVATPFLFLFLFIWVYV